MRKKLKNVSKNKCGALDMDCNKVANFDFGPQIAIDIAPLQKLSRIKIFGVK